MWSKSTHLKGVNGVTDVGVGDLLVKNHGDAVVLAPILPLERKTNTLYKITKTRLDSKSVLEVKTNLFCFMIISHLPL